MGADDEAAVLLFLRAEVAAEDVDPFTETGQAAPAPGELGAFEPEPSVPTSTVISPEPWRTRTEVRLPWAYLRAFVRDSCTTR